MIKKKYFQAGLGTALSIAVAVCCQVQAGAQASDEDRLVDGVDGANASSASQNEAASAPSEPSTVTLHGAVKKEEKVQEQSPDAAQLQSQQAQLGSADILKAAIKKLKKNRVPLSAEEYRSFGVGCVGFETYRSFLSRLSTVEAVYAGSPAEKAGIREGDKIQYDDDDEAGRVHPNPFISTWAVTLGQEGSQVNFTLIHGHEKTKMSLSRMNIEDLPDPTERHQWEQMIRHFGNQTEGTFVSNSLRGLFGK